MILLSIFWLKMVFVGLCGLLMRMIWVWLVIVVVSCFRFGWKFGVCSGIVCSCVLVSVIVVV